MVKSAVRLIPLLVLSAGLNCSLGASASVFGSFSALGKQVAKRFSSSEASSPAFRNLLTEKHRDSQGRPVLVIKDPDNSKFSVRSTIDQGYLVVEANLNDGKQRSKINLGLALRATARHFKGQFRGIADYYHDGDILSSINRRFSEQLANHRRLRTLGVESAPPNLEAILKSELPYRAAAKQGFTQITVTKIEGTPGNFRNLYVRYDRPGTLEKIRSRLFSVRLARPDSGLR